MKKHIVYDWYDDHGILIYRSTYEVKDQNDYNRVIDLINKFPNIYKLVYEY